MFFQSLVFIATSAHFHNGATLRVLTAAPKGLAAEVSLGRRAISHSGCTFWARRRNFRADGLTNAPGGHIGLTGREFALRTNGKWRKQLLKPIAIDEFNFASADKFHRIAGNSVLRSRRSRRLRRSPR